MKGLLQAATAASVLGLASVANAQTPYATQPVQPVPQQQVVQTSPPPPPNAYGGNGEYVAPLQQQTQPTYVPQSVALSGPRELKNWNEGDPIPPGYHPVSRVRGGLIAAGLATFLPVYLISALVGAATIDTCKAYNSYASGCRDAGFLLVPVAGPFIEIAHQTNPGAAGALGLTILGLAQAGGVAMFVMGIAWPRVVLVRNDLAKTHVTLEPVLGAESGFKLTF